MKTSRKCEKILSWIRNTQVNVNKYISDVNSVVECEQIYSWISIRTLNVNAYKLYEFSTILPTIVCCHSWFIRLKWARVRTGSILHFSRLWDLSTSKVTLARSNQSPKGNLCRTPWNSWKSFFGQCSSIFFCRIKNGGSHTWRAALSIRKATEKRSAQSKGWRTTLQKQKIHTKHCWLREPLR